MMLDRHDCPILKCKAVNATKILQSFSASGLARLDKGAKPEDWITTSCTTTGSNQCVVIEGGDACPEIRVI